jgi:hypothetical protein
LFDLLQDWTINFSGLAAEIAAWKIVLWNYNVPTWLLATILWAKKYVMRIIFYFIGKWDEKKLGFWKAQNEYGQKKQHLAPFNDELRQTLEEICNKLEIKSKFKNYE